jgi:hypothetical protein
LFSRQADRRERVWLCLRQDSQTTTQLSSPAPLRPKISSGNQEASPCSSRLAIPAQVRMHLAHLAWRTWLAHLVGALGWRTWLAHLDWQPWVGSLPHGDLGLATLGMRSRELGTLGHGTRETTTRAWRSWVDILAGTSCRHRTSIWHTAGWRTWFSALGRGALRRGDLGCAARAKGSGCGSSGLGRSSSRHTSLAHWLESHGATLLPRSPGTLNRKTSPAG